MAVRRRAARRAPGQHFLRSRHWAADLVAEAGVAAGDLVVEIGAGTGVLTSALAHAGADVVAIERDPALAAQLRTRFDELASVEVVECDAAGFDWPGQPFVVVANLPFARSGAIVANLLAQVIARAFNPLRGAAA